MSQLHAVEHHQQKTSRDHQATTAWIAGEEPAVVVDFQGMIDYASSH